METEKLYPSNSLRSKTAVDQKAPEIPKLEKQITGNVVQRKKPILKRMSETFLADTIKNSADHIVQDVLIPAAKSMVCDIVGWGGFMEQLLFGYSGGGKKYSTGSKTSYSYNSIYNKSVGVGRRPDPRTPLSRPQSSSHIQEIILDNKVDAEDILTTMVEHIERFGQVTVADLYSAVGVAGEFTDNRWGWEDLSGASVKRVREGYLIVLPKPAMLE